MLQENEAHQKQAPSQPQSRAVRHPVTQPSGPILTIWSPAGCQYSHSSSPGCARRTRVGSPQLRFTSAAFIPTRMVFWIMAWRNSLHWPGSRRSTALGANGASTFSHPEGCSYTGFAPVGAPPSVRTKPAHFRTRRVLLVSLPECWLATNTLVGRKPVALLRAMTLRRRSGSDLSLNLYGIRALPKRDEAA